MCEARKIAYELMDWFIDVWFIEKDRQKALKIWNKCQKYIRLARDNYKSLVLCCNCKKK